MTSDMTDLARRFALAGKVTLEASPLGGTVVRLTHGPHSALVALQGAQVLEWRHHGHDVLWLAPAARLGTAKAVRGGIPVCWPWFGPNAGDPAKPQHGFVRTRDWTIEATGGTSADGRPAASVTLGYRTGAQDAALWPHEATVRLSVVLDDGLSLVLETTAGGAAPFDLTEALHTYFRIGDVSRVRVEGLEGREYLDKVVGYARRRQAGAITIGEEVDRIYVGDTSDVTLVDEGLRRRIAIRSTGSRSAVVWNPWVHRTAQMGDMGGPDAYRQMLCIETANAGDDVIRIAPGGRHVMTVRYDVAPA